MIADTHSGDLRFQVVPASPLPQPLAGLKPGPVETSVAPWPLRAGFASTLVVVMVSSFVPCRNRGHRTIAPRWDGKLQKTECMCSQH